MQADNNHVRPSVDFHDDIFVPRSPNIQTSNSRLTQNSSPTVFFPQQQQQYDHQGYSTSAMAPRLIPVSIDMCKRKNMEEHSTIYYDIEGLVLRRGQAFSSTVTFNQDFNADKHHLCVIFKCQTWLNCPEVKIPLDGTSHEWSAKRIFTKDHKKNQICLQIHSPSDALIGQYSLLLEICPIDKGLLDKRALSIFQFEIDIYLLFNPWQRGDACASLSSDHIAEYVLNEHGEIYLGVSDVPRSVPWYFGQFESVVLLTALAFLNKVQLSVQHRIDSSIIPRILSSKICSESKINNGIFSSSLDINPLSSQANEYSSSPAILKLYLASNGQSIPGDSGNSWQHAGVLCSLCRSLGIPCRIVTVYNAVCPAEERKNMDTNLHTGQKPMVVINSKMTRPWYLWNECWIRRDDLPGDHSGWQVLDSSSIQHKIRRLGPCSVAALKSSTLNLKWDTAEIYNVLNGNKTYWLVYPDGNKKLIKTEEHVINTKILTKSLQTEHQYEDITSNYKAINNSRTDQAVLNYDVDVDVKTPHSLKFGDDLNLTVITNNRSNAQRTLTVTLTALRINSIDQFQSIQNESTQTLPYDQNIDSNIHNTSLQTTNQSFVQTFPLHQYQQKPIQIKLAEDTQVSKRRIDSVLKLDIDGIIKETGQTYRSEKYILNEENVSMKSVLENEVIGIGELAKLNIEIKNSTIQSLNNGSITIDGFGVLESFSINKQIPPHNSTTLSIDITPPRLGIGHFYVTFSTDSLQLPPQSILLEVIDRKTGKQETNRLPLIEKLLLGNEITSDTQHMSINNNAKTHHPDQLASAPKYTNTSAIVEEPLKTMPDQKLYHTQHPQADQPAATPSHLKSNLNNPETNLTTKPVTPSIISVPTQTTKPSQISPFDISENLTESRDVLTSVDVLPQQLRTEPTAKPSTKTKATPAKKPAHSPKPTQLNTTEKDFPSLNETHETSPTSNTTSDDTKKHDYVKLDKMPSLDKPVEITTTSEYTRKHDDVKLEKMPSLDKPLAIIAKTTPTSEDTPNHDNLKLRKMPSLDKPTEIITTTTTTSEDTKKHDDIKLEKMPSIEKPIDVIATTTTTSDDPKKHDGVRLETMPSLDKPTEIITTTTTISEDTKKHDDIKLEKIPSLDKPTEIITTTSTISEDTKKHDDVKLETLPSLDKPTEMITTTTTISEDTKKHDDVKVEQIPSLEKPREIITTTSTTTSDDTKKPHDVKLEKILSLDKPLDSITTTTTTSEDTKKHDDVKLEKILSLDKPLDIITISDDSKKHDDVKLEKILSLEKPLDSITTTTTTSEDTKKHDGVTLEQTPSVEKTLDIFTISDDTKKPHDVKLEKILSLDKPLDSITTTTTTSENTKKRDDLKLEKMPSIEKPVDVITTTTTTSEDTKKHDDVKLEKILSLDKPLDSITTTTTTSENTKKRDDLKLEKMPSIEKPVDVITTTTTTSEDTKKHDDVKIEKLPSIDTPVEIITTTTTTSEDTKKRDDVKLEKMASLDEPLETITTTTTTTSADTKKHDDVKLDKMPSVDKPVEISTTSTTTPEDTKKHDDVQLEKMPSVEKPLDIITISDDSKKHDDVKLEKIPSVEKPLDIITISDDSKKHDDVKLEKILSLEKPLDSITTTTTTSEDTKKHDGVTLEQTPSVEKTLDIFTISDDTKKPHDVKLEKILSLDKPLDSITTTTTTSEDTKKHDDVKLEKILSLDKPLDSITTTTTTSENTKKRDDLKLEKMPSIEKPVDVITTTTTTSEDTKKHDDVKIEKLPSIDTPVEIITTTTTTSEDTKKRDDVKLEKMPSIDKTTDIIKTSGDKKHDDVRLEKMASLDEPLETITTTTTTTSADTKKHDDVQLEKMPSVEKPLDIITISDDSKKHDDVKLEKILSLEKPLDSITTTTTTSEDTKKHDGVTLEQTPSVEKTLDIFTISDDTKKPHDVKLEKILSLDKPLDSITTTTTTSEDTKKHGDVKLEKILSLDKPLDSITTTTTTSEDTKKHDDVKLEKMPSIEKPVDIVTRTTTISEDTKKRDNVKLDKTASVDKPTELITTTTTTPEDTKKHDDVILDKMPSLDKSAEIITTTTTTSEDTKKYDDVKLEMRSSVDGPGQISTLLTNMLEETAPSLNGGAYVPDAVQNTMQLQCIPDLKRRQETSIRDTGEPPLVYQDLRGAVTTENGEETGNSYITNITQLLMPVSDRSLRRNTVENKNITDSSAQKTYNETQFKSKPVEAAASSIHVDETKQLSALGANPFVSDNDRALSTSDTHQTHETPIATHGTADPINIVKTAQSLNHIRDTTVNATGELDIDQNAPLSKVPSIDFTTETAIETRTTDDHMTDHAAPCARPTSLDHGMEAAFSGEDRRIIGVGDSIDKKVEDSSKNKAKDEVQMSDVRMVAEALSQNALTSAVEEIMVADVKMVAEALSQNALTSAVEEIMVADVRMVAEALSHNALARAVEEIMVADVKMVAEALSQNALTRAVEEIMVADVRMVAEALSQNALRNAVEEIMVEDKYKLKEGSDISGNVPSQWNESEGEESLGSSALIKRNISQHDNIELPKSVTDLIHELTDDDTLNSLDSLPKSKEMLLKSDFHVKFDSLSGEKDISENSMEISGDGLANGRDARRSEDLREESVYRDEQKYVDDSENNLDVNHRTLKGVVPDAVLELIHELTENVEAKIEEDVVDISDVPSESVASSFQPLVTSETTNANDFISIPETVVLDCCFQVSSNPIDQQNQKIQEQDRVYAKYENEETLTQNIPDTAKLEQIKANNNLASNLTSAKQETNVHWSDAINDNSQSTEHKNPETIIDKNNEEMVNTLSTFSSGSERFNQVLDDTQKSDELTRVKDSDFSAENMQNWLQRLLEKLTPLDATQSNEKTKIPIDDNDVSITKVFDESVKIEEETKPIHSQAIPDDINSHPNPENFETPLDPTTISTIKNTDNAGRQASDNLIAENSTINKRNIEDTMTQAKQKISDENQRTSIEDQSKSLELLVHHASKADKILNQEEPRIAVQGDTLSLKEVSEERTLEGHSETTVNDIRDWLDHLIHQIHSSDDTKNTADQVTKTPTIANEDTTRQANNLAQPLTGIEKEERVKVSLVDNDGRKNGGQTPVAGDNTFESLVNVSQQVSQIENTTKGEEVTGLNEDMRGWLIHLLRQITTIDQTNINEATNNHTKPVTTILDENPNNLVRTKSQSEYQSIGSIGTTSNSISSSAQNEGNARLDDIPNPMYQSGSLSKLVIKFDIPTTTTDTSENFNLSSSITIEKTNKDDVHNTSTTTYEISSVTITETLPMHASIEEQLTKTKQNLDTNDSTVQLVNELTLLSSIATTEDTNANKPNETSDEDFVKAYNELNDSILDAASKKSAPSRNTNAISSSSSSSSSTSTSDIEIETNDDINDSTKEDNYEATKSYGQILADRIWSNAMNDVDFTLTYMSTSNSDSESISSSDELTYHTANESISDARNKRTATMSTILDYLSLSDDTDNDAEDQSTIFPNNLTVYAEFLASNLLESAVHAHTIELNKSFEMSESIPSEKTPTPNDRNSSKNIFFTPKSNEDYLQRAEQMISSSSNVDDDHKLHATVDDIHDINQQSLIPSAESNDHDMVYISPEHPVTTKEDSVLHEFKRETIQPTISFKSVSNDTATDDKQLSSNTISHDVSMNPSSIQSIHSLNGTSQFKDTTSVAEKTPMLSRDDKETSTESFNK